MVEELQDPRRTEPPFLLSERECSRSVTCWSFQPLVTARDR